MRRYLLWIAMAAVIGFSGSSFAATGEDQCPPVAPQPIMATHTLPPYPVLSQRIGEQGPTKMVVEIDVTGTPTNIEVVRSSGSLRLDDAAVAHVKQFWRWKSATRNCKPVAVKIDVSVVWDLSQPSLPADLIANFINEFTPSASDYPSQARLQGQQGEAVILVLLAPDGKIKGTQLAYGTGSKELDDAAMAIVRRAEFVPARVMGQPAKSTMLIGIKWSLPANPQAPAPPSSAAPKN